MSSLTAVCTAMRFCPNAPKTVAVAGSKGPRWIWDLETNPGVWSMFQIRFKKHSQLDLENRESLGRKGVWSIVNC
ncbi:hypothetical protein PCANC_24122 [Puccinia coronata f. sp. avenae]|uniref:Uncharacterized protein n=1 Tax=Puccinia coronata f. sp. avenae TaxID=200324 RepID=A0A2N5SQT5_9BASI|nr:hypothetical protein PCANC_24122 [Puccinia coronata f. sp. avenae]